MIYGSLILMALFSVSYTYSYWPGIVGDSVSINNEIPIGEWVPKRIIHVHSNLSQTFDDFDIEIEPDTSLGDDFNDYFKFASLDPLPKDHSGVDLSLYTFDNWYLPDGTIFTKNKIVSSDLDVYPSWNLVSTQLTPFTYDLKNGMYNIYKTAGFNLTGDLYFPGWRYKGREINQLGSDTASLRFTNYDFGGSLTIGAGIKKILTDTFRNATATSLTLEEGLEDIQIRGFNNLKTAGDLIFPSTLKTIGNYAFQKGTFDGELDFSLANQLTTTGIGAFDSTMFQGDFILGSGFVSISKDSFKGIPFNGILDLSKASNLEDIGENAFSASKFTTLIFPPNGELKLINTAAFKDTGLRNDLVLPNGLETVNGQGFSGAKFDNIYIPLSVTFIGSSALFGSTTATIYYAGSAIPSDWHANWNFHNRPVVLNAVF